MQAPPDDRPSSDPSPTSRKSWLGRPLRLGLWVAGSLVALVGLYAALGFWVAPRVIRSQVVAQIDQRYHRKASIGEVRFNPFTLKLDARAFNLPDADGKAMIGFDRLAVNVSIASIWKRGVVFNEIALDAPKVRLVRRPDGRVNIQDLIPPPSGKPLPKVMIDHLAVRQGRAEVVDLARKTPFSKTFTPIGFTLNDFSTVKDGAAYVLNAVSEQGEGLAWRGTFGLQPLTSQGTFALSKIKIPALWELAADLAPFDVTGGELNLTGGYRFTSQGEKLTLAADVDDLRLTGAGLRAHGADADWVTLPSVVVSKVHVDVPTQTISVGRIEAASPTVTAWTEAGGGINLARYAPVPADAKAPAAAGKPEAKPWKVDLPDLRVKGAKIAFEERSAATPVKMTATPLDVIITGLALPIAKPVQVEASTALEGGGRFGAKGTVTLDKVAAQFDIDAAGIDLVRFQPYIDDAASLNLLSGKVSAKGHVVYAANGAAKFDGAVQVDNLHTVDKVLQQDFVNWRTLRLEGVSAATQPLAVKVREVVAQEPYARVVVGPNYVMNIATVLNPKGAAAAAAAVAPKPAPVKAKFSLFKRKAPAPPPPTRAQAPVRAALPIEIALVRVEKGKMDFSDLSIEPHFIAGIQELNGTIKGLSGRQDARAQVDMTGQVDRFSPVKIDGQINYFAARSYTDVTMTFKNMELTTFSPYSGKFAGYRINKGKLAVDLHYNIDDQKLDANHRVVIDQLELGEKVDSADAVKLPVKLIVALLKDRRGVIDLPIAINGTLDDPKFKVWPVIWKVVGDLLVKVATSPFDLLASLGSGGPEMQYIDFAPGTGVLDDADRQKLVALGKALSDRPALNLEVPMPVSPLDKPAMLEARYQAALSAAGAGADVTDSRARLAALEALYLKQFGAKPELPKPAEGADKAAAEPAAIAWLEEKLRAGVTVSDQDVQQLGRTRAEAVQALLLGEGQIDPSRVFVTAQPPLEEKTGPVRMTLSLS